MQRLTYDPAARIVEIDSLNLLARPMRRRVGLDDIRHADTIHPMASFEALGKMYFVDPNNFPNVELLAKLTPVSAEEQLAMEQQRQQQQQGVGGMQGTNGP